MATEWDSHFFLLLDLLCDVMVRLSHRANDRAKCYRLVDGNIESKSSKEDKLEAEIFLILCHTGENSVHVLSCI